MAKISNVYKDNKTGKWYYVASLGYDGNGKRIQHWKRGFLTQRDAKRAYDEHMANFSKTAFKMNSTMNYEEFYKTYFEPDYKRSVGKSTFESRATSMRKHFSYFYKKKLKDINAPMLKRWQNHLSEEKYSNSYIRATYGLFQKSLDLAVTLGLIQTNLAKQVGNVKKEKRKVEFWTLEEFEKVISTFDTSDYYQHYSFIIIWLLFMTGLRKGEGQALEWDDIDFNEKTLRVSKSMYYKNVDEYYINEPKTRSSSRVIFLDDDTIHYLQKWKELQSKNIISRYVLSYNGLPMTNTVTKNIIDRHSKLAKINSIKTHALRHSHASLLISLGENALVIRDRLGHEDIETTLGTYGHLYNNANKDVANRLRGIIKVEKNEKAIREMKQFGGNQYIKKEK